jgi:hypothetical protein
MEAVEWARAHGAAGEAEVVSEQPWARVTRIGDVWLKECSPVQAFEVPLTVALGSRWADRVPRVLAAEGARLLLADAGSPIAAFGDVVDAWEALLPLYAELQQGETAHAGEHLAAAVPDLRAETLPARYEAWAEREARLAPLAQRFGELCASLTRPPTVQHDDLAGPNAYARDGNVTVLDWGDTCIAHPFATMYVTLRWTAHFHGDDAAARVRAAYLDAWEGEVGDELARTLPVAAFARVLQWDRIGHAEGTQRNLEMFLETIAGT